MHAYRRNRAGTARLAVWIVMAVALVPALAGPSSAKDNEDKAPGSEIQYGEPVAKTRETKEADKVEPEGARVIDTSPSKSEMRAMTTFPMGYVLKHSFSLVPPPYPVPYSCYDLSGGYRCRSVYGYEEGGSGSNYDSDYEVYHSNTAAESSWQYGYGQTAITRGEWVYEGCEEYTLMSLACDYATYKPTRRQTTGSNGYWLDVLKSWAYYTYSTQVGCASYLAQTWPYGDWSQLGIECGGTPLTYTPGS
jgi:hypothetical protein